MKNSIICILCLCLLAGCRTTTPTVSIANTITENAEGAKKVIRGTSSLDQCKIASVAQIDAIVRQANDMAISHKAELESKDKDIRFWFWWVVALASIILGYIGLKIKNKLF